MFDQIALFSSALGLLIGLPILYLRLRKELGKPKLNYRPKPDKRRPCRYKLRAQLPWQVR